MNTFRKKNFFKGKEKGQIIVILALVFIGLVAVVGLAIDLGYLFVSYSRLRRAVDAAALSATSQFREGYTIAKLESEARQFLKLNGIDASDPNTLEIQIQTCETTPGDAELCTTPARKLVRVKVRQNVPLFFLAVVGIRDIPITQDAISEAASVDLVLLIDNSDSMTWNYPEGSPMRNPSVCNIGFHCEPMETIKSASLELVDRLFPGYDRISVVTFNRYPYVNLELSSNPGFTLVKDAIDAIQVYEGEGECPYTDGVDDPDLVTGQALIDLEALIDIRLPDGGTCRRKDIGGVYGGMDCPAFSLAGDPSLCGSTNIGGGLRVAGNVLGGLYPSGFTFTGSTPTSNETALWVVVLLTDGITNTGYSLDGVTDQSSPSPAPGDVLCPTIYWLTERRCADQDARPTVDHLQLTPAPGAAVFAPRHAAVYPNTIYDPDDYARDMVDFVTNPDTDLDMPGQSALLFTIGLNEKGIAARTLYELPDPYQDRDGVWHVNPGGQNLPAPAETLLRYGAYKGSGIYYFAPSSAQLGEVFLAIANKIATRLSR